MSNQNFKQLITVATGAAVSFSAMTYPAEGATIAFDFTVNVLEGPQAGIHTGFLSFDDAAVEPVFGDLVKVDGEDLYVEFDFFGGNRRNSDTISNFAEVFLSEDLTNVESLEWEWNSQQEPPFGAFDFGEGGFGYAEGNFGYFELGNIEYQQRSVPEPSVTFLAFLGTALGASVLSRKR